MACIIISYSDAAIRRAGRDALSAGWLVDMAGAALHAVAQRTHTLDGATVLIVLIERLNEGI